METQNPLGRLRDFYMEQYAKRNPKSRQLYQNSNAVLPGGTTRSTLIHPPHPLYLEGGRECYVRSVDGDEYLDFVSEYTAGMFGHSHPEIAKEIETVIKSGFTLGGACQSETELARLLVERFPSVDAVRFCNSGTEANMMAIATGLHFTRKPKVNDNVVNSAACITN